MLFLVYGLFGCCSLGDWLFTLYTAFIGFDSFAECHVNERKGIKSES